MSKFQLFGVYDLYTHYNQCRSSIIKELNVQRGRSVVASSLEIIREAWTHRTKWQRLQKSLMCLPTKGFRAKMTSLKGGDRETIPFLIVTMRTLPSSFSCELPDLSSRMVGNT